MTIIQTNSLDKNGLEKITAGELMGLAAVDYRLYEKFFPHTFRDPDPIFAAEMWDKMESTKARFVNIQMYRGSGKTTRMRTYISKRIAYGVSRTMLYIAASSTKAEMSVAWVKRQVERNEMWRNFYGLRIGSKWTDVLLEIVHERLELSVWLVAFGLTGKHRGINLDDYRPDFIGIDDIIDEEVAASSEQREKAENLVLGSLVDSLAPASENPQSKMVMLQTPFNHEDPSMKALADPMWTSMVQGCWTKETENLPLEFRRSVWPERESSEELRLQKIGAIARNKASLFAREKECKLITPESSAFKREWLRYYSSVDDIPGGLKGMWTTLGVDPVPPPSPRQIADGFRTKDFEALVVIGYKNLDYYLLEYIQNRGHDPEWTVTKFFELALKWRIKQARIEPVAYQRTLSWLVGKAMDTKRIWYQINDLPDTRPKPVRIVDAFAGIASRGHFFVRPEHSEFISQFTDYPAVIHDDLLDAGSMAISSMAPLEIGDEVGDEYEDAEPLRLTRGAP